MFPRSCFNADGRLRVKIAAPVAPSFNAGVACGSDFVYGNLVAPDLFVNGLPVTAGGVLALDAGAPDVFSNGIPFNSDAMSQETGAALHFQNGMPFNGDKIAIEVVI